MTAQGFRRHTGRDEARPSRPSASLVRAGYIGRDGLRPVRLRSCLLALAALLWLCAPLAHAIPQHVLERRAMQEQMRQAQAPGSVVVERTAPAARPGTDAKPAAGAVGIVQIPDEELDFFALREEDVGWINNPKYGFHHLQTEHFVIHSHQKEFGSRVAKMAESFYAFISKELPPETTDRMGEHRSHILVFAKPEDWRDVIQATRGVDENVASFVVGQAMYLQELGDSKSEKMSLLAHEMTHLVMNRFLQVRLPLWLNEGLAEFYGEFAYRAIRGMGQSKSAAFPPLAEPYPLAPMFRLTSYPASITETRLFYRTSKYMVGFLRLKHTPEAWNRYITAVAGGNDAVASLLEAYGYPDIATLETAFRKFAH